MPEELNEKGGKRQFGNQGGRTTRRVNHKEVIFLFCLGTGQAGELVCGGPSRIAGVTGHDARMCKSKQYVRVANMGLKPKKK